MSDADELLNAILEELAHVDGEWLSARNERAVADSLFEVWILTLLASAALDEGMVVRWRQRVIGTGGPVESDAPELVLRRQQGELYVLGVPPWTFLRIECDGFALEAHADIRVRGRSRVASEADILLLPAATAATCVATPRRPRNREPVAVVEAKWLSSSLDPVHGRAFVTLLSDLQPSTRGVLVCSRSGAKCLGLIDGLTTIGRFCGDVRTTETRAIDAVRAELASLLRSWHARVT